MIYFNLTFNNYSSNAFITKIKKIVPVRIQSLLAERTGFARSVLARDGLARADFIGEASRYFGYPLSPWRYNKDFA